MSSYSSRWRRRCVVVTVHFFLCPCSLFNVLSCSGFWAFSSSFPLCGGIWLEFWWGKLGPSPRTYLGVINSWHHSSASQRWLPSLWIDWLNVQAWDMCNYCISFCQKFNRLLNLPCWEWDRVIDCVGEEGRNSYEDCTGISGNSFPAPSYTNRSGPENGAHTWGRGWAHQTTGTLQWCLMNFW